MSSKRVTRRIAIVFPFLLCLLISAEAFHSLLLSSAKCKPATFDARKNSEVLVQLENSRHLFSERNQNENFGETVPINLSQKTRTSAVSKTSTAVTTDSKQLSRNHFFADCRNYLTLGIIVSAATSWSSFPDTVHAKLYSENAANLERINNGDFSGGSVFNNNPTTERGKKRRAMTGCKVTLSREEASRTILKRDKMLSEKDCNTMVMDGDTEFMLQALRNLDCPTCANGIGRMD